MEENKNTTIEEVEEIGEVVVDDTNIEDAEVIEAFEEDVDVLNNTVSEFEEANEQMNKETDEMIDKELKTLKEESGIVLDADKIKKAFKEGNLYGIVDSAYDNLFSTIVTTEPNLLGLMFDEPKIEPKNSEKHYLSFIIPIEGDEENNKVYHIKPQYIEEEIKIVNMSRGEDGIGVKKEYVFTRLNLDEVSNLIKNNKGLLNDFEDAHDGILKIATEVANLKRVEFLETYSGLANVNAAEAFCELSKFDEIFRHVSNNVKDLTTTLLKTSLEKRVIKLLGKNLTRAQADNVRYSIKVLFDNLDLLISSYKGYEGKYQGVIRYSLYKLFLEKINENKENVSLFFVLLEYMTKAIVYIMAYSNKHNGFEYNEEDLSIIAEDDPILLFVLHLVSRLYPENSING